MKQCSDCEGGAVCDFCRLYNFNGSQGAYVGRGYCVWHEKPRDPGDGCKDFICEHYKRENLSESNL